MDMTCQVHDQAASPSRREPATHCIGGWVGPRAGLDAMVKRKPLSLPGIEQPSVQFNNFPQHLLS